MSNRITDDLTQNALNQAVGRRSPQAGLIHHSDRGSQYASGDYQALLKKNEIIPSMSRKGDCWDNAVAESFFHTLKVEKINRHRFKTSENSSSCRTLDSGRVIKVGSYGIVDDFFEYETFRNDREDDLEEFIKMYQGKLDYKVRGTPYGDVRIQLSE